MLRALLVFAVLIPGLVAALSNRFYGLLLYVWIALFRPQEFTWVDISSLRLSLISGIVLVFPSLMTGIWPNITHPLSVGAVLFFISALMAQTGAYQADIGWFWIDFLGRLLLVCLLAVTLVQSRQRFLALMSVIALSFGFHTSKAGLYSIAHGGSRFADGLAGAYVDNNGYALGMVMTLWLLVGVGKNVQHRWLKRALYASAALTAFAAVSTFSRGGFLALVASASVYVLLQRRKAVAVTLVAVALFVVPFIPLPEGYLDRISTIQTYEKQGDASALGRIHFWRVAVDMAIDNPLGVGLFNYEAAYDKYDSSRGQFGHARAVHSSFFQVLAETGFFGAAVYSLMIAYSLLLVARIRRRSRTEGLDPGDARMLDTMAQALGASMIGFVVGGAFIALALNDLTWLLFALMAALDGISRQMCAAVATEPRGRGAWLGELAPVSVPVALPAFVPRRG